MDHLRQRLAVAELHDQGRQAVGLADHEIMGLALGLAQAVYGESTLNEDPAPDAGPVPSVLTATVAVDRAALLDD